MSRVTATTTLVSNKDKESLVISRNYTQARSSNIELDDADAFNIMLESSKAVAMANLPTAKYFLLINEGIVPVEISIHIRGWKTASGTNGNNGVDGQDAIDLDSDAGTAVTAIRYLC